MKLTLGTRIYYAGDICNDEGAGTVVAVNPPNKWQAESYDLEMDDGRTMRDMAGVHWEPGSGCRFFTLDEYHRERRERIAQMKADWDRLERAGAI